MYLYEPTQEFNADLIVVLFLILQGTKEYYIELTN